MPMSPHPKLEWPKLKAIFGHTYNEHGDESAFLFDYQSSSMSREEFQELTGFGYGRVKDRGGAIHMSDMTQGYTAVFRHTAYGLGGAVTREDLDDNLYFKKGSHVTKALAFSARSTWQKTAALSYDRFGTTGYEMADGTTVLSTAHPTAAGNVANRASVDASLSEASLEDMCIIVGQFKSSAGMPFAAQPRCLVVNVSNSFEATRILESQLRSGSSDNDINAMKFMGMLPEGVKISHYTEDQAAWYIRTDVPDSMIGLTRVKTEFTQDNEFLTQDARFVYYFRKSEGVADWRGIAGST